MFAPTYRQCLSHWVCLLNMNLDAALPPLCDDNVRWNTMLLFAHHLCHCVAIHVAFTIALTLIVPCTHFVCADDTALVMCNTELPLPTCCSEDTFTFCYKLFTHESFAMCSFSYIYHRHYFCILHMWNTGPVSFYIFTLQNDRSIHLFFSFACTDIAGEHSYCPACFFCHSTKVLL